MSLLQRLLSVALIAIPLFCPAYAITLQEAEDTVLANGLTASWMRAAWLR